MAAQDVARLRGEADGAALRLRHHNAKLHHRLAPHGEVGGGDLRRSRAGPGRGARRPAHAGGRRQSRPARTLRAIAARPASRATSRPIWRRRWSCTRRRACSGFTCRGSSGRSSMTGAPGWRAGPARTGAICARIWPTRRRSRCACASCSPIWVWPKSSARSRKTRIPSRTKREEEEQPSEEGQGEGAAEGAEHAPSEADAVASADEAAETGPSERLEDAASSWRRRPGGRRRAVPDAPVHSAGRRGARLSRVHHQVRRGDRGQRAVQHGRARPAPRPARPAAASVPGHDRAHGQSPAAPPDGPADPLLGVRPR